MPLLEPSSSEVFTISTVVSVWFGFRTFFSGSALFSKQGIYLLSDLFSYIYGTLYLSQPFCRYSQYQYTRYSKIQFIFWIGVNELLIFVINEQVLGACNRIRILILSFIEIMSISLINRPNRYLSGPFNNTSARQVARVDTLQAAISFVLVVTEVRVGSNFVSCSCSRTESLVNYLLYIFSFQTRYS